MSSSFDDWFNEQISYGLRSEFFYEDLVALSTAPATPHTRSIMVGWLRAAYEAGYHDSARAEATPPVVVYYRGLPPGFSKDKPEPDER